MSVLKRQNLALLACKYLNSQVMANTYLYNTSKSYATDLSQFLQPLIPGKIYSRPSKNGGNYKFSHENSSKLSNEWSEKILMELAKQASKSWKDLSAASRNRKNACVRSFFKWLYQKEYIDQDLSLQIHTPRVPKKIPHFLSVDEIMALIKTIEQANDQPHAKRDLTLILLLYGGGLRVSEACHLKWKQVNLPKATLTILGKGEKERLVSLPNIVIKNLKTQNKNSDYVFGDSPLGPRTAYEIVRSWGRKANLIKPLNPHALRHSYATHLLSSGSDIRTLQELLGHESLTATEKYLHLGLHKLAQTLEDSHPLGEEYKKKNKGKSS